MKAIIADKGPQALAMVQDPRPSGKYYTKRFMNALGSANVYTHGAACNLSKESGIQEATGAQNFSVDFPNTKMVVFIGRSYGDRIRPSSVKSLPSMPIWCTPMASTPANAPGPTTLMKMIAYTSSGNARSTSSTNLPTRARPDFSTGCGKPEA